MSYVPVAPTFKIVAPAPRWQAADKLRVEVYAKIWLGNGVKVNDGTCSFVVVHPVGGTAIDTLAKLYAAIKTYVDALEAARLTPPVDPLDPPAAVKNTVGTTYLNSTGATVNDPESAATVP